MVSQSLGPRLFQRDSNIKEKIIKKKKKNKSREAQQGISNALCMDRNRNDVCKHMRVNLIEF